MRLLLSLVVVVVVASATGCRDDSAHVIWGGNFHKMRYLVADIEMLQVEGKSKDISTAIKLLQQKDPDALRMYDIKGYYALNPDISHYTNATSSNVIAIVAKVTIRHPAKQDGRKCYLGVNFGLEAVELDTLPSWAEK